MLVDSGLDLGDFAGEVGLVLVSCWVGVRGVGDGCGCEDSSCKIGIALEGLEGLDDDLWLFLSGLGGDGYLSLAFMGDSVCISLAFSSVVFAEDFGLLGGEGAGCLL